MGRLLSPSSSSAARSRDIECNEVPLSNAGRTSVVGPDRRFGTHTADKEWHDAGAVEVDDAALLGSPSPIKLDEVPSRFRAQVIGFDRAGQLDSHPDLIEVGRAVEAPTKVGLKAAAFARRKRPFEVVGDEFDRLLTHDVLPSE